MDRKFCNDTPVKVAGASPPSEAWYFAQILLGKPVPSAPATQANARATREQLGWLATIAPERGSNLRAQLIEQADARADIEQLRWLAQISRPHESQLRSVLAAEAGTAESQERWLEERSNVQEADWDPSKHPRGAFSQNRGWFSQTAGPSGSRKPPTERKLAQAEPDRTGARPRMLPVSNKTPKEGTATGASGQPARKGRSFFDAVRQRNSTVTNLTGASTPEMVKSTRLATELEGAARLAVETNRVAVAGLRTGGKSLVNGAATAVKNVATLGLSTHQLELIGVTKEDRDRGYDTAVSFAAAGIGGESQSSSRTESRCFGTCSCSR